MKLNDNKIHLVYGEKGSGKTTLSAFVVDKLKSETDIYSNYPLDGSYKIELSDLKKKRLPAGSVIIIDEAAGVLNCRDWRQTGTELLRYLQLIRHMECTLYFLSQSMAAIDIQVKDLCDDAILCERRWFGLSRYTYAEKAIRRNGHVEFFLTRKMFWLLRKKYYKYFDTHYLDETMEARDYVKKDLW